MNSTRRTAALVGLLFLVATTTYYTAFTLMTGALDGTGSPTGASAAGNALTAAALLAFVTGLAAVGIAVLLYPLLRRYSESLALGYVVLRAAELAAILHYMAVPLLAIGLGGGPTEGAPHPSAAPHLGSLLRAQHDATNMIVFLIVGAAGCVLVSLLNRSQLVPRPITVLGGIGYPVMLVGTVLHLFGLIDMLQGVGTLAAIPVGLFELVLPVWLLAKGFNVAADS